MISLKSSKKEYLSPRVSHSPVGIAGFVDHVFNHNLGVIPDFIELYSTIAPNEYDHWIDISQYYSGNAQHVQGYIVLSQTTTQVTIRGYGWYNHFYIKASSFGGEHRAS